VNKLTYYSPTQARSSVAGGDCRGMSGRFEGWMVLMSVRTEPASARPVVSTTYASSTRPEIPAWARAEGYRGMGCSMTSTGASTAAAVSGSVIAWVAAPRADAGAPGANLDSIFAPLSRWDLDGNRPEACQVLGGAERRGGP
jgi:hypothetical protein